jgi:hypothetical protein
LSWGFGLCLWVALAAGGAVAAGAAEVQLLVGGRPVRCDVLDEASEWVHGLSGRDHLPLDTGLWFVFATADYHGIWMKDMRFAIDILWVDEGMRIVTLKEGVEPATYPTVFRPVRPARYVLEVPAGFARGRALHVGDPLTVLPAPPATRQQSVGLGGQGDLRVKERVW